MDGAKLFSTLEQLRFDKPVFVHANGNFFPQRCLSGSLASWSVTTSVAFINAFYHNLAIASPLSAHAKYLTVPPIRLRAA
jgi:hypothetical protein